MIDISIALGDDPSTWSGGVVTLATTQWQGLVATGVPELRLVHETGSDNVFYHSVDPGALEVVPRPDSMILALKESMESSPARGYGSVRTEVFEFTSAVQRALMEAAILNTNMQ